jgi:hypothetical protein
MKRLLALGFVAAPLVCAGADNYLGLLKPPATSLTPTGLYSFTTGPTSLASLAPDNGYRLKLGYKYSRYLSVEGEFSDVTRSSDVFANPASLSSAFRSTGFAVDTVATLPVWRFSFYGRLGAYHGDRYGFSSYSTALLGNQAARGTRWRYGLGVRYDFTQAFGIRAELERYSALGLGSPFAGDVDSDQVTVGVSWRF